jgi:hypothetical protein
MNDDSTVPRLNRIELRFSDDCQKVMNLYELSWTDRIKNWWATLKNKKENTNEQ